MITPRTTAAFGERHAAMARMAAVVAVLLLPIAFLYTRAGSEVLIGLIDGLFLLRSAVRRRWAWLREPWVVSALPWWGWIAICSTPLPALGLGESGWRSCMQALLLGRFFVLAAALSVWLLHAPAIRRAAMVSMAAAAGWIVLQCWQQYLFGSNLAGWHRWMDGALTGPFRQPRAGPALVLILFPAVLPGTAALLRRHGRGPRIGGVLLFALAVATMVLIGQRMPALLTGLGLIACGIALPRLRPVVLGAAGVGAVLLIATPFVSPPTFQKLVVHFADQMHHFPQSPYGLLYVRAAVMGAAHPVTGLGFDGFRHGCNLAEYQHGLGWLGITDAQAAGPVGCSIHPHNHYLEAFTAGGLPGLLLFCLMVTAWLATLGRGLLGRGEPERVACFIAVLLGVWPFASTSAFFTLPNAGWLFLVLGTGMAMVPPQRGARAAATVRAGLVLAPRRGQGTQTPLRVAESGPGSPDPGGVRGRAPIFLDPPDPITRWNMAKCGTRARGAPARAGARREWWAMGSMAGWIKAGGVWPARARDRGFADRGCREVLEWGCAGWLPGGPSPVRVRVLPRGPVRDSGRARGERRTIRRGFR